MMMRWLIAALPGHPLWLPTVLVMACLMNVEAQAQDGQAQDGSTPNPPAGSHQKQPDGAGFSGRLILGGLAVPDYEGSKDYSAAPIVAGRLSYDNYYIDLKGPKAKINLSPFAGFEFGPSIGLGSGRGSVKNDRVDDMHNIDDTIVGGAFVRVSTKKIILPADELAFGVEVLTDLGGKHHGTTISFGPSYSFSPIAKVRLGVDISATYASGSYTNTFFGVDASDAQRSGLSPYNAHGGIKDVGVMFNVTYQWNKHWGITGIAGYKQLVGDAADSPIVDKVGSAGQAIVGTGIVFKF